MPGIQQRLARTRSPPRNREGPLGLGYELTTWLKDWSWGESFATSIAHRAHDKQKAGCKDERVKRLAGCHGEHKKNAETVVASLAPTQHFPPLQSLDGAVRDVILPFDAFHWLRGLNKPKFEQHLGRCGEDLVRWWTAFKSSTEGRRMWDLHPWLRFKEPVDLHRHLPLMVFDDAGVTAKSQSAFVRVFYSLTGVGSAQETKVVTALAHKLPTDEEDTSWPPILDSFEQLAKPVDADGCGGVLLFLGSDLEYICVVCGMNSYNSAEICGFCLANGTTFPHTDYSPGAGWRTSLVGNATFKLRFRQPLHPLVDHEWFSKYTYRMDTMHMNDHHGVAGHVAGNLFDINLSDANGPCPGNNREARLEFLNGDIRAFNSATGCRSRLPSLKLSNIIGAHGYPELHGMLVKAGNTRHIIPYCVDLQERAVAINPSNDNKHAFKVVSALNQIYEILYGASTFLTPAEIQALQVQVDKFARHYQWLAVQSANVGIMRWKQQPKHHYVIAHLVWQAMLINPARVQGYANEGMVGIIARIFTKSMRGPHHQVSAAAVLKKYCSGMVLEWVPGAL